MNSENLISKKLREFAHSNDWLISGEYIYGQEQGFLFTGIDSKKQKTFITPVPGITKDQENDLFEILNKNINTMKLNDFEITDDFLCIRIKDSLSLKSTDLELIIALLTGAMQEVSIVAENRCQECGEMDANSETFLYDLYCYIHEDCLDKIELLTENESSSTSNTTKITKSDINSYNLDDHTKSSKKIIFSTVGAIIGSLPWLLLPFVLDLLRNVIGKVSSSSFIFNFTQSILTCICAYLISYFALTGYRLSKSRFTIEGRWIVGITSAILVILVQFAYLAVYVIKTPGISLTISTYSKYLTENNFYINLILGAAIGIIFTLITVLPFFDSEKTKAQLNRENIPNVSDNSEESLNMISESDSDNGSEQESNDIEKEEIVDDSLDDKVLHSKDKTFEYNDDEVYKSNEEDN